MKIWVGVGLVGIGAAALAGPYFSGAKAETKYNEGLEYLNTEVPGISVSSESYEKGYFGADAVTVINIDQDKYGYNLPPQFKLSTHFSHGAYSASATSHLELDEDTKKVLKEIIGDKAPIEIVATANLLGETSVVISTPEFSTLENGNDIAVSAMQMTIDVAKDRKSFDFDLNWPGVTIVEEGKQIFKVDGFSIDQINEELTNNIWVSNGDIKLNALSFDDNGTMVNVSNAIITSTTGEVSPGFLDTVTELSVENLKINEDEFKNQNLIFALKDLSINELDLLAGTLEKFIEATQTDNFQEITALQPQLIAQANALVSKGVKVEISNLFVNTKQGDVKGQLHLEQPASDNVSLEFGPQALLQTTKGDVSLSVPVSLLLEKGPAGMEQQLAMFEAQKFIVKDGDEYKTNITLDKMDLDVNGQKIPLAALLR